MKDNVKKYAVAFMLSIGIAFFMTGCVEHRYYHEHHHHSPDYYHRHHMPPPPGVDIDIHN
jgi:hypothetical protein